MLEYAGVYIYVCTKAIWYIYWGIEIGIVLHA